MKQLLIGSRPLCDGVIVVAQDAPFDLKNVAWRLQTLLKKEFDLALAISPRAVCRKRAIRLTLDKKLQKNDYAVSVDEKDNLTLAAGHYTGIVCAYRQIEAQILAGAQTVTPFSGKTDLPLSWRPDPSLTGQTVDHNGTPVPLCNREVLTDYDYTCEYTLVWNDEFDGTAIDLEKWSGAADMNMCDVELSFDPPVVDVRDGKLVMTATCDGKTEGKPYRTNYTVATHDTMNFSGGYLEMRAKVPCLGLGEWPSFWLLSCSNTLFSTAYRDAHDGKLEPPYTVEVDVFEQFTTPKNCFIPNLHKHFGAKYPRAEYDYYNGEKEQWLPLTGNRQISGIDRGSAVSGTPAFYFDDDAKANDYHTFGFLWTRERMAFSVDGVFYYAYRLDDESDPHFNPRIRNKATGAESVIGMEGYRHENLSLSVLLNNMLFSPGYANGPEGGWVLGERDLKAEDHDRVFPLVYEVDYVRLYQTKDDILYTPAEAGLGEQIYDDQSPRWDYALRGKK